MVSRREVLFVIGGRGGGPTEKWALTHLFVYVQTHALTGRLYNMFIIYYTYINTLLASYRHAYIKENFLERRRQRPWE
jgi:hypothetical protein